MLDKSKYENIEIPENLHAVVRDAIDEGTWRSRSVRNRRILKWAASTAAAFALCFITLLNASPAFAQAASGMPVIGALCQIFTFREYHFENKISYIDAEIPQIDNTGKSELEERINLEIQMIINELLAESEERAKEYYKAFVETGGEPEDFIPVGITVDYEVKHISPECASFVIYQYETRFSAYNNSYYYNIDMESGRMLSLKDCLGNDYQQLAADSIEKTIASWDEAKQALLWDDLSIAGLISENTDFYINSDGQIVVVIGKYEAAAGAAGTLEFVIQPAISG